MELSGGLELHVRSLSDPVLWKALLFTLQCLFPPALQWETELIAGATIQTLTFVNRYDTLHRVRK